MTIAMIPAALAETFRRNGFAPHLPLLRAERPTKPEPKQYRCQACAETEGEVRWSSLTVDLCFVRPEHGPGEPV